MSNVIDFKENCKVMIDRKTTELVTKPDKPDPEEPKDNKDNKDKIIEDLINKVKDLEYRIEELEEKFW
jgi:hypothetical protein